MMLERAAQTIIVLLVVAVCDFLFREVLFVAILGTYAIHGAKWLIFYGALAVMSACLVAVVSRANGSIGPRDGCIFGALMGGFFGMGNFIYFAQAPSASVLVEVVSCLISIGQFAIAGWTLGILKERYATPQAK